MPTSSYWQATRAPRYSLLFVAPLLVLYELLAFLLTHDAIQGVRNGADVLLKSLFVALGGRYGVAMFGVVLLGTGAYLVWRDVRRSGPPQRRYFLGMGVESVIYAALFGSVTSLLTTLLLRGPSALMLQSGGVARLDLPTQLMVSLGAGIYEELLFRVLIVGLLARLGFVLFGWGPRAAGVMAAVVGALIFSAFHYIGPLGDHLELGTFVFRTIAGLLLSGLFLIRGFGIAAWTHALYDVLLALTGTG
ncbi:MAG TPA: CPBP family intramembrane glutamic endopeptidase [Gemmatimonadales bacterium]|nr:CPBP family intramembrane glutamic endopeptidase [Gemmatimonadales bacterium]